MTWYHPALAQRALDAGDKEIASLRTDRENLIRALQSIAGLANNLQSRIAKEALLGVVGGSGQ